MGCCWSSAEDDDEIYDSYSGFSEADPNEPLVTDDGDPDGSQFTQIDPDSFDAQFRRCEQLGMGQSSVVYRVVHKRTGDEYACKVMQKERNCPLHCFCSMHQKVREEVSTLKKMNHKHIYQLHHVFETSNNIFIVTELMRGRELFYNIEEKSGAFSEAALAHMHEVGVAHRDLKPENVMFGDKDESIESLKLIDFGFSKDYLRRANAPMTTMLGSRGYIAPEIMLGESYNEAVDMWSLGVITYSLLCGYLPVHQNDPSGAVDFVLEFHPDEWGDVSQEAKDFCSQCLEKSPHSRITAEEALEHPWLAHTDIGADVDRDVQRNENERQRPRHRKQGSEALKSPRQLHNSLRRGRGLALSDLAGVSPRRVDSLEDGDDGGGGSSSTRGTRRPRSASHDGDLAGAHDDQVQFC